MAKTVRAKQRGYIGNVLREQGEKFEWPDGVKLGSWVEPVRFGGKGDHDGDGKDGGTKAVDTTAAVSISIPADWQTQPAKDRKALADQINGSGKVANANDADAVISAYVEANKPEAFGDAPAPVTVQGNGVNEALGGAAPDWVAPSPDVPVAAADDE